MTALKELGYNDVYHMKEVYMRNDADFWVAAFEAKYEGKGAKYGKEQWDHLLGDCMAVTDIPAAAFARELVAAYPDAKVILTTRSVDGWYRSMLATVYAAHVDPWRKLQSLWDAKAASMWALRKKYHEHLWWNDFPRYGKRFFQEHNDLVRSLVPSDRLLEYEVSEGWEPLCAFLGKEVPAGKVFPWINKTDDFQRTSREVTAQVYWRYVQAVARVVVPVAAVGAAFWWRSGIKAFLNRS
ncbi:hypothetical protein MMC32_001941 [Xylographa parallela]|nr:hypothetical protein [Xylographa parallela]